MTFDPARDFVPIALVSTTPNVIAVSARSPYRTVADIIQAARQNPAQADLRLAGRRFVGAPDRRLFRGHGRHLDAACAVQGTSASLPAVAGGQVDLLFDNLPGALAQIQDGGLVRGGRDVGGARSVRARHRRGIGAAGLRRDRLVCPVRTARHAERRQAIDRGGPRGLRSPDLAARFAAQGAKPGALFGPELAAFEQDERRKWGGLVRTKGITAQ